MVVRTLVISWGLWLSPSAWAGCPSEVSSLSDEMGAANQAFAQRDLDGFKAAMGTVRQDLACITGVLSPEQVVTLYDLEGRAAFLDRDHERAIQAFQGVLRVEPGFAFQAEVVPPGHPLDRLLAEAQNAESPEMVTFPVPDGLTLLADAAPANVVPDGWVLLQSIQEEQVLWTELHTPTTPWPAAMTRWHPTEVEPQVKAEAAAEPLPAAGSPGLNRPLMMGAGGTLLVSGGLFVAALSSRGTFLDPATPYEELDRLESRTQTLSVASEVGLGASMALFTASWLTAEW